MATSSQDVDFFASSPPPADRVRSESPKGPSLFRGGSEDSDVQADVEVVSVQKRRKLDNGSAEGGSSVAESSTRKQEKSKSPSQQPEAGPSWHRKYVSPGCMRSFDAALTPRHLQIGHFCVAGWALSKGKGYAEEGAKVTIKRDTPRNKQATAATPAKKQPPKKQTKLSFGGGGSKAASSSTSSGKAKQNEDYVVRFSNMRGFEVGRLPAEAAVWVSKLMDLGMAEFEGQVVACPPVLTVGCDILLDIKAYLRREAFPDMQDVRRSRNIRNEPTKSFFQETSETTDEKDLRQRKSALIRLFKACDLKPTQSSDILQQHAEDGKFGSSSMLEHFGGQEALRRSQSPTFVHNGGSSSKAGSPSSTPLPTQAPAGSSSSTAIAVDGEDEAGPDVADGTELEENQMARVYSKAQKHDRELPEVDPPDTFALSLRPYQKQALGWMQNMEKPASMRQGREGQRQDASLHPLWQEYRFPEEEREPSAGPSKVDQQDDTPSFYFNPYIGEMSLQFQPASQGTRGGILADEMGLGKTIMVASLIHANRPTKPGDGASPDDEDGGANEDDAARSKQVEKRGGPRQTSLASAFNRSAAASASRTSVAGQVTLVIAPMSLVGQWKAELERASNAGTLSVLLHYGDAKAEVMDRLEGGSVDVVITSYGTLVSEYKRFRDLGGTTSMTSASSARVAKQAPLYAIDWHRVILDEAHTIRNRTTQNARACRDLVTRRRWCLTGSPIVNRLTDLYSLLNFLRVEPWGDFAFFNSFIGKPFANKNPKALEIVQVILESLLLRREKNFMDKEGKPIVSLPSKTVEVKYLDFTDLERRIYDLCFDRAWTQYQRLSRDGSVTKNLSIIFTVIMRLRQAVCHPLLVLKALQESHRKEREAKEAKGLANGDGGDEDAADEAAEKEVAELVAQFQADDGEQDGNDEDAAMALASSLDGDNDGDSQPPCPVCNDEQVDPAALPCGHTACKACFEAELDSKAQKGLESTCIVCEEGPYTIADLQDAQQKNGSKDDEPAAALSKPSSHFPARRPQQPLRTSAKLSALLAVLASLRAAEPDFKGVIFSQFTSFLDLVQSSLSAHGHAYVRLDGTTSQKDREKVLAHFASVKGHIVILVSLRAGGVGLNLVSARHCWLLDCWWAESIEQQAVDRVHRIGQTRDVVVHRYLIKDSIEERILRIQKRKTALVNEALAGARGEEAGERESETVENLRILFGDD